MKKYKLTTEISPIKIEIDYEPNYKTWEETLKEMHCSQIDVYKDQKPIYNSIIEIISEETFKVLNNICNIEMDKYGERTYICNNIRMKIEEDNE